MKLIVLLVGLVVGFGAGVYWGVHHPVEAAKLAEEEERRILEAKLQVTQAVKEKLDQIIARQRGSSTPGSGFVARGTAAANPELVELRDQQERRIAELHEQLQQVKSD